MLIRFRGVRRRARHDGATGRGAANQGERGHDDGAPVAKRCPTMFASASECNVNGRLGALRLKPAGLGSAIEAAPVLAHEAAP
jgi:hypothetical protein